MFKKYQKHMALALISATTILPLEAQAFDISTSGSISRVASSSLGQEYKLNEILQQSLDLLNIPTSTIKGLDIDPTIKYIEADNRHLVDLKNTLEVDGQFSSGGALTEIKTFAAKLSALNTELAKLENQQFGQGEAYLNQINDLKKLIHIVDAHMDLSSEPPIINYENILYGENSGQVYEGISYDGVLKVINVPSNLASAYPIKDLIWPSSGKPNNIQIAVKTISGPPNVFVNEGSLFPTDSAVAYDPNSKKNLGTIDMDDYYIGADDFGNELCQVTVEYIIKDTNTGKSNKMNLILKSTKSLASRAMPRSSTPARLDQSTTTSAVPILVSESSGKDISPSQFWVSSSIFNNLKNAIDLSTDLIMNIFKETNTTLDFATSFELSPIVDFADTSIPNVPALRPDEKPYLFADITVGSDLDHSTLAELSAAYSQLNSAYDSYISQARFGTMSQANFDNLATANFAIQLAKAQIGIRPINETLPTQINNSFFYKKDSTNSDFFESPIYLYVKKATASDISGGATSVFVNSSVPAPQAQIGDLIIAEESNAEDIVLYNSLSGTMQPLNNLATENYFMAPIICDDPYLVGLEIPGGPYSGFTDSDKLETHYITTLEAARYLTQLRLLVSELSRYDGLDSNGNSLSKKSANAEISAGNTSVNGKTRIASIKSEITDFISSVALKSGQVHAKEAAINELRKLLMHLGYCELDGDNIAQPIPPADLATSPLEATPIYQGGLNNTIDSNEVTNRQSFDLADHDNDDPSDIKYRGQDSTTPFYDISDVEGIDIPPTHYWVSDSARDTLANAATRAHNLIHSKYITCSQTEINENLYRSYSYGLTNLNSPSPVISSTDYKFYTTELVNKEVDLLSAAINDYDESAQLSTYSAFGSALDDLETNYPITHKVHLYFTPAQYDSDGKISMQRRMTPATGKTFISHDGIYEVTREILTSSEASGQAISSIENVELMSYPVTNIADYGYVSSKDVDNLEKAIGPLLNVLNLSDQLQDYGSYADDSKFVKQAKEIAKMYAEDNQLETLTDGIDSAIQNFEDKIEPVIPYKDTRDSLQSVINTARTSGILIDSTNVSVKVDNGIAYLNSANYVISDDNGFSYKTYDLANKKWSEPISLAGTSKKWISSADLKNFNVAIEKAEKIIQDTMAIATEINKNITGDKSDDIAGEELTSEPITGTEYASVKFNSAAYNSIIANKDKTEDYFKQAEEILTTAQTSFVDKFAVPNTLAGSANTAYQNFKTAIGSPFTIDNSNNIPVGQIAYGYVSTTASGISGAFSSGHLTSGSGILDKVYGIKDTSGKITDYFPVNVYVVDDSLGIVNPLSGRLYGDENADDNKHDFITGGPTQFVHIDAARKFITAIESIDKFLAKPMSDHFIAYAKNTDYFNNALSALTAAEQEFIDATKNIRSGTYIDEYKRMQSLITKTITSANQDLADGVSKFVPKNDSPNNVVALKLSTNTGESSKTPGLYKITDKDHIILNATVKVFESTDGINKKDSGALTQSDYWVSPTMFGKLKSAIWQVQELVTSAENLNKVHILGYVANPDHYFDAQVNKIGLEDAKNDFELIKVLHANNSTVDCIKAAKIILYGKTISGNDVDGPGGTGAQADANISDLTDGFDIFTLAILKSIDTDNNKITDTERDVITIANNYYYFSKEYIDDLRDAITELEIDPGDQTKLNTLIGLVNRQYAERKVIAILNNPKIDLYNSYIEAKAKLKDTNGRDILPSDNNGDNIPSDRYWVRSSVLEELETALENSEALLNKTETEKAHEVIFTTQLKNQISINDRAMNFEAERGKADTTTTSEINTAKVELLKVINLASAYSGGKPYSKNGQMDENGVTSDLQIVASDFGIDVIGQDTDNDLVPNAGNRWTTEYAIRSMQRSITTAVAAYNNPSHTISSLEVAKSKLEDALNNFKKNAEYGTLATYKTVVNYMSTLVNNIEDGNSGYANSAPIIRVDDINTDTTQSGLDVAPNLLWSTETEVKRIKSVAEKAKDIIMEKANIATGSVSISLESLVKEYRKLESAYHTFYGRDIDGQPVTGITPKALPGTAGVSSLELRKLIESCVANINSLVYLPGAERLEYTYTKFDGTPLNLYGFNRCTLHTVSSPDYEQDSDSNSNASDNPSSSDIHVSSKNGIDVPSSAKWITTSTLNRYAVAIRSAQNILDRFESDSVEQDQADLDSAVLNLNFAHDTFSDAIQIKDSHSSDETDYLIAYKKLYGAIESAYSLVGKDINGEGNSLVVIHNAYLNIPNEIDDVTLTNIQSSLAGDGGELTNNHHWVTSYDLNRYINSIANAKEELISSSAGTNSLENSVEDLQDAVNIIVGKAQVGRSDEKDSALDNLNTAIMNAKLIIEGDINETDLKKQYPLEISNNGKDIPNDRYWTSYNNYKNLTNQFINAKIIVLNASTVNGGTGKSTIDELELSFDRLSNALTNLVPLQVGEIGSLTSTGLGAIAKIELRLCMAEAYELRNFETSSKKGIDIAENLPWVTEIAIAEFLEPGTATQVSAAITPIDFIIGAYNEAAQIFQDNSSDETAYEAATRKLQNAITQFNRVKDNTNPANGNAWTNSETIKVGELSGGIGKLDSTRKAKSVLRDRIELIEDLVNDTESSDSDGADISDGEYYASQTNLDTIESAIETAKGILKNPNSTEAELTAGSNNGNTHSSENTAALDSENSALAHLNSAYELFSGVSDGNSQTNSDKNFPGDEHRKLKGPMSGNVASQLGVAHDIVMNLLDSENANTRPIIPVAFVIDPNTELPYADSAIGNLPDSSITKIESYIEDLLKNAINNEEIGIEVKMNSLATNPVYDAPTNTNEGSITGFTVVLKDTSITPNSTWTIQKAIVSGSPAPSITDEITLKIEIAKSVDKWNALSKADIFHAASLLINAYESEELLVDHYSYDPEITSTPDDVGKLNTHVIAKIFKKQIEELISNPAIKVNLYEESEDENIDLSSSSLKPLTDNTSNVNAITNVPIPGTADNNQGTAGEFECKVVLAINYSEIAEGGSRAFDRLGIEDSLEEVTKDHQTTPSGNDLDIYTVITVDPIIVKIEAKPYSVPAISDTIAVNEAMKVLPSAPTGFTLDDPTNTIGLVNAQISMKINDLLMTEKSGYDPEMSKNVKFEIVEDFSGSNNGFVEPEAPGTNGSYHFKIRFKQNNAEEISKVFSIATIAPVIGDIEWEGAIQTRFGSKSLGLEESEIVEMPYVDFEQDYFEEEWEYQIEENDMSIAEIEFVDEIELDFVAEELKLEEIIDEEIILEEYGFENGYFEENFDFEIFDELLGDGEEAFLF
ncbi:MAG: hypothetical protein ATN31_02465 [Candidatus Epulonipiscioides saccharophilum]|nr:MAG: hypothetical protein ATN31_02465 [Epulopiscium sp. AS2M-Bin001]